jgi:hypothetical protein
VFFVPAGYVFAIWGVIYIGWIAYSIYQIQPAQRNNARLNAIAPWFWLAAVANSAWLFLWHWNYFGLTLLAMFTLLGSLIMIYITLRQTSKDAAPIERWLVSLPFSVYLGWVSVATIANVTDVLDWIHWDSFGIAPTVWAAVMLAVACVVGLLMQLRHQDRGFLAVLLWAFVGIALKHAAVPLVTTAAWLASGFILILVVLSLWQQRRQLT